MKRRLILILLISVLSSCATYKPEYSGDLEKDLQSMTEYYVERNHRVGLGLLYYHREKGSFYAFSGHRDIRRSEEINRSILFEIGSASKLFVSTVIMQLVEEGFLTLKGRLSEYGFDFPRSEEITIKDLLQHTSRIPDYFSSEDFLTSDDNFHHQWTSAELLNLGLDAMEITRDWSYSNTNYVLLAQLIKKITGTSTENEIRRRILKPLNMNSTYYRPTEKFDGNFARGYNVDGSGRYWDAWSGINPTAYSYAGGMISTVDDMRVFLEALFNKELISGNSLLEMHQFIETPNPFDYGLGLLIINFAGIQMVGHGGNTLGTVSYCLYGHEEGEVLILFSTIRTEDILKIEKSIEAILDMY